MSQAIAADVDAPGSEIGHHLLGLGARGPVAADEDDVLGAAIGEPARRLDAEAAEAAGDEVDALGRDREGRFLRLHHAAGLRRRDDDLTDMPRLLHQPEGVRDLVRREGLEGQRLQPALLEQGHDLAEQPGPVLALVLKHLVEVDAEVGQVPAERPQADMGVGDVVALAQLDEAAERLEDVEAALHRLAEQAVQHHADAVAGDAADVVDEGEGARVEHVLGAQRLDQGALLARAGRGDDPGALQLGDLQGREADAAGAAMDQHPLAAAQAGAADEAVIGGEEGDRHGGGGLRIEAGRARGDDELGDDDVGREARLREGDDAIAGLEGVDALADGEDPAGDFEAEARAGEAVLQDLLRQHRQRPEDVAEIEAGGLDRDLDLAAPGRPARRPAPRPSR